jgi:hypothetical protein
VTVTTPDDIARQALRVLHDVLLRRDDVHEPSDTCCCAVNASYVLIVAERFDDPLEELRELRDEAESRETSCPCCRRTSVYARCALATYERALSEAMVAAVGMP